MLVNKQSSSFCGAFRLLLYRLPISESATEAKFLHYRISFPLPLPFSPTPIHVHSGSAYRAARGPTHRGTTQALQNMSTIVIVPTRHSYHAWATG